MIYVNPSITNLALQQPSQVILQHFREVFLLSFHLIILQMDHPTKLVYSFLYNHIVTVRRI